MLMEPGARATASPQLAEGITACEWVSFDEARQRISYPNAREILEHARGMVADAGSGTI
jgi:hypothetical protein